MSRKCLSYRRYYVATITVILHPTELEHHVWAGCAGASWLDHAHYSPVHSTAASWSSAPSASSPVWPPRNLNLDERSTAFPRRRLRYQMEPAAGVHSLGRWRRNLACALHHVVVCAGTHLTASLSSLYSGLGVGQHGGIMPISRCWRAGEPVEVLVLQAWPDQTQYLSGQLHAFAWHADW